MKYNLERSQRSFLTRNRDFNIVHTKTTLKIVTFPLVAFVMMALASDAQAKQYKQIINGKEVVVHSNAIPVILHRMVPPQYGRHVTQKEVSNGKILAPRATAITKNRS